MHHSLPYPSPLLVQNSKCPAGARLPSLNRPPKCPATHPAMSPSIAKKTRKSPTL
ncbi:hypothetical protein E2C01_075882 [Portunus trituberculatus]|uniref:Uncharacterized protein n=1 Tax=Portunus trituberculatus TaxID=210409 RepID=A0A5B7IG76_PORTR|nr:hypothetical protein [Portunus trituberculatus]